MAENITQFREIMWLTQDHLGPNTFAAILNTTFANAYSQRKIFEFGFKIRQI